MEVYAIIEKCGYNGEHDANVQLFATEAAARKRFMQMREQTSWYCVYGEDGCVVSEDLDAMTHNAEAEGGWFVNYRDISVHKLEINE